MGAIKTLFTDIGGVLMTNGWDRHMRAEAVIKFHLNKNEFDKRHKAVYDIYESGKISLDDYLNEVVFWTPQSFSMQDFKNFVFAQSKPYPEMIHLYKELKEKYGIRIAAISNEGVEIADYRIKTAHLTSFIDEFFISSYLGYQKPKKQIFDIALQVTQTPVENSIYIDDRTEMVEAARSLGFKTFQQVSLKDTEAILHSILA